MSNPDGFIEEVTEEVRRDKLFALMRRYGWIAILAVVLLVAGAAYKEYRNAQQTAAARAAGDAIIAAVQLDDPQARIAALGAIDATSQIKALAAMLAADEAIAAGDMATATAQFATIAQDPSSPLILRQVATLKLVMAQGAATPADERRETLQPLSAPGQPLRPLALEQLALIEAEQGNAETAIARLREAMDAADATPGLRQRASQLIVALGGTPDGA